MMYFNMLTLPVGSGTTHYGMRFSTDEFWIDEMFDDTHMTVPVTGKKIPAGFSLVVIMDKTLGGDAFGASDAATKVYQAIAGDPASKTYAKDLADADAFTQMCSQQVTPEKLKQRDSNIPVTLTEMCVGEDLSSEDGITLTNETDTIQIRWMSVALGFCLSWNPTNPSFKAEFEIAFEFDFPGGEDAAGTPLPNITLVAKAKMDVFVGALAAGFNANMAIFLKDHAESQILANPFGELPNMGFVLPIAFGIGLSFEYALMGIPVLKMLEMEAGILACGRAW